MANEPNITTEYITEGIPDLPAEESPEPDLAMQNSFYQQQQAPYNPNMMPPPQQAFFPPGMAQNMNRPMYAYNPSPNGIPQFEVVPKRRTRINPETKKQEIYYENVEYVTILTPGDKNAMPRKKVNDSIRAFYRVEYENFRKGLEMAPQGTPVEMWPILSPAQVMTLKAQNIFTVENLRDMPDANLHVIPMGKTLKLQATAWLKEKEKADQVEIRTKESQALKDGLAMMEEKLAQMSERLEKSEAEKTRIVTENETLKELVKPSEAKADSGDPTATEPHKDDDLAARIAAHVGQKRQQGQTE